MLVLEPRVAVDAAVSTAVQRLVAATQPEAVILFGSRARGDSRPGSDWDLCVVLPDDVPHGKFTPITLWPLVGRLGPAIDVRPIRRSVFAARRGEPNSLSRSVAREGVVLYQAPGRESVLGRNGPSA